MSGLSEEEKKRIQDIEEARAEARKNIALREEWKRGKPGMIAVGCFILAGVVAKFDLPNLITYFLVGLGVIFLIVFAILSSEGEEGK